MAVRFSDTLGGGRDERGTVGVEREDARVAARRGVGAGVGEVVGVRGGAGEVGGGS